MAIGGNVLVYSSLDAHNPPSRSSSRSRGRGDHRRHAGMVDVDVDPSVNVVSGEQLDSLVGSYAKVRLVSGSLVTAESLQSEPLVAEGGAVVAIQVAEGSLPVGLRERVPVVLVIPRQGQRRSRRPDIDRRSNRRPADDDGFGARAPMVSVEVARADAATVAAADDVRVVLVEPTPDPASDDEADS